MSRLSITSINHKVILVATITNCFHDEFESIVYTVISTNQNFVIVGNFNVHIDDIIDIHGSHLRCLFDEYGLRQHVQVSTHSHGHTLDHVVTADTTSVSDLDVRDMH